MKVHFMNVGQGNMVLIQIPNSINILYDCNVTEDNEEEVLGYLSRQLNGNQINYFINSHRDADHMRGVKKVHGKFNIEKICDSGVPGTTTDTTEYREYMELCREITTEEVGQGSWTAGPCAVKVFNGKNPSYSESNDQSLVVRLEYKGCGVMLTGDTSARPWADIIAIRNSPQELKSAILLASHHGSYSFFEHGVVRYTKHIEYIKPDVTVVSVGDNPHGHPDRDALQMYEAHSTGGKNNHRVLRTDEKGNMLLSIDELGSWKIEFHQ